MTEFRCKNVECFGHLHTVQKRKVTFVYKNGEAVPTEPIFCGWCDGEMECFYKAQSGAPYFNRFGSLSDSEKKRVLKKRADDHYKKEGKEKKREYFKIAMKRMTDE